MLQKHQQNNPPHSGFATQLMSGLVGRKDVDNRIGFCAPTEKETFDRPGQVRPLRNGSFNRGRGDAIFTPYHPSKVAGSWRVNTM